MLDAIKVIFWFLVFVVSLAGVSFAYYTGVRDVNPELLKSPLNWEGHQQVLSHIMIVAAPLVIISVVFWNYCGPWILSWFKFEVSEGAKRIGWLTGVIGLLILIATGFFTGVVSTSAEEYGISSKYAHLIDYSIGGVLIVGVLGFMTIWFRKWRKSGKKKKAIKEMSSEELEARIEEGLNEEIGGN